jgi:hypothetical protein
MTSISTEARPVAVALDGRPCGDVGDLAVTDLVWYAAYGSNMRSSRLAVYLRGGRQAGNRRTYPGCRDPRPPRRTYAVTLPGTVYFALESPAWGGGMAFYDPTHEGRAAGVAHLLTREQFTDIAAQEMYLEPGTITPDLETTAQRGRTRMGPGRYETVVCPGRLDQYPVFTFTAPWRASDVTWRPPAPGYLASLAAGLHESHGWGGQEITDYLTALPGLEGHEAVVEQAVDQAVGLDWQCEDRDDC